jgi:hypothetical protein
MNQRFVKIQHQCDLLMNSKHGICDLKNINFVWIFSEVRFEHTHTKKKGRVTNLRAFRS